MTTAADFDTDLEQDERRLPWDKIVIGALPLAVLSWFLVFRGTTLLSEPDPDAAMSHYPAVAVVLVGGETERAAVPIGGMVAAERIVSLRAREPSEVMAVTTSAGAMVDEGQPLCRLRPLAGGPGQVLTSPIAGKVSAIGAVAGTKLEAGGVCVSVTDPSSAVVTAELSPLHAKVITAGDEAELAVGDTKTKGDVRVVYPQQDPRSAASRLVEIEMPEGLDAAPGTSAKVRIRTEQIVAVHIPFGALTLHPKLGMAVRLVEGDERLGTVRTVAISLVAATDDGFYVEGLPANARLVVEDEAFPAPPDGEKVRIGKVV